MSIRSMSALLLGAAMLLAGCGDAETSAGDDSSEQEVPQSDEQASSSPEESYSGFEDFPGEELLYYDSEYQTIGMRIKTVGSDWVTEFLDRTAPAGTHYLVVYVVVTGELDDRGLDSAELAQVDYSIELRFKPTSDDCLVEHSGSDPEYCYYDDWNGTIHSAQLTPLDGDDWSNYQWMEDLTLGVEVDAGQTMVGALAFGIPDDVDAAGDFEFCARGKDNTLENDEFPCIPVPAPEPRG